MIGRHTKLLDIVNQKNRVEVVKLAELLGVSQVTVRKDLDTLEKKGLLRREHGHAVKVSSDDIGNRLAFQYELKQRIARMAAELVGSGETVMIESGSCCALLAAELAFNRRDVTIVTNSAFIASYIRQAPFVRVVLLGGEYQPQSQVLVGPITSLCASEFYVDKLFIGTDGFSSSAGFTGNDYQRAATVRTMAKYADNVVVLTESTKFERRGVAKQFDASEVDFLFTDDQIPASIKAGLIQNGIHVQTVPVSAGEPNQKG
ncbi:DeoR/GlpR family DNA-binding transcription regulator [Candidatus Soleaferrea massiliensis]|uniref:DeoR/GlpR family DNA-binding transcription regulator n=1 Tax=Candidatus Soleaferrea massiliensis TaxID=1470354 RepID=UPI00058AF0B1|nr:DeoR/GlpR family DNA-binding transcription regulator [Candidatus Soleaferrea massiliensis]